MSLLTDTTQWPTRETHYVAELSSPESFLALEQRLDGVANLNRIEGGLGRVRHYDGLLGSTNKILIMDSFTDQRFFAHVVHYQSSAFGIPLPMPKPLKAIFQEYGLEKNGFSALY